MYHETFILLPTVFCPGHAKVWGSRTEPHWLCKGKSSLWVFDLSLWREQCAFLGLLPFSVSNQSPSPLPAERGIEAQKNLERFLLLYEIEKGSCFCLICPVIQNLNPLGMLEAGRGRGVSRELGPGCGGRRLSPLNLRSGWHCFLLCLQLCSYL